MGLSASFWFSFELIHIAPTPIFFFYPKVSEGKLASVAKNDEGGKSTLKRVFDSP